MARYALNMPVQLKRDAERIAAEQGVSLNQLILWALAEKVGALNAALDDPAFPGIAYRRGAAGMPQAVLRGRGIRVQTIVVAYEHERLTITDIAAEYDLTVAQVEEALQFYRAHAADVDRHIDLEATIVNDQFAPKLHLDADASRKSLLRALVNHGHDVTRTPCAWMPLDASDVEQLHRATAQGRVIFTFNIADFVHLAQTFPAHGGIVVAQQTAWSTQALIAALHLLLSTTSADDWPGQLRWLNDWRR